MSVGARPRRRREGRARVPLVGILATRPRLVPPATAEGFDRVDVVGPGPRSGGRQPRS